MTPHSFTEWVLGANVATKRGRNQKHSRQRRIISLDWNTDEDTGDDSLVLRVPRAQVQQANKKKVAFADTERVVDASASEDGLEVSSAKNTTEDESVGMQSDSECPCRTCAVRTRKLRRLKQANKVTESAGAGKGSNRAQVSNVKRSTDTVAAEQGPDSDCPCRNCDEERRKLKKTKQAKKCESKSDAEIHAAHLAKKAAKRSKDSSDKPGKRRKERRPGDESDTAEESQGDDGGKSQEQDKSGKAKGNLHQAASKDKVAIKAAGDDTKSRKKEKGKTLLPSQHEPPIIRRPELLMPIQAQVLQVEHAVETPEDPRPNAFYDLEHGIMRVYHGPSYGNPHGVLYPKRLYDHRPLPGGTPHPSQNPWFSGFISDSRSQMPPPPQVDGAFTSSRSNVNPWFQGYGTTNVPGGSDNVGYTDAASNRLYAKDVSMPKFDPLNPFNWSPSERAAQTRKQKKKQGDGPASDAVPITPGQPGTTTKAKSSSSNLKADSAGLWDVQSAQGSANKAALQKPASKDDDDRVADKGFGNSYDSDDSKKLNKFLETMRQQDVSQQRSMQGSTKGNDIWGTSNDTSRWNNSGAQADWGNDNQNSNNNGNDDSAWKSSNGWGANNDNNAANGTQDNGAQWGSGSSAEKNNPGFYWSNDDGMNGQKPADIRSNASNRSQKSRDTGKAVPGAWPGTEGGNVGGPGSYTGGGSGRTRDQASGASPASKPPSVAGNVAGRGDDWGDVSKNGKGNGHGNSNGGAGTWADPTAANDSGGYWDNEGKGTEKQVDNTAW